MSGKFRAMERRNSDCRLGYTELLRLRRRGSADSFRSGAGSGGDEMRFPEKETLILNKKTRHRLEEKVRQFLVWSRSRREISTRMAIIGLLCCLVAAFGLRLLTLYAEPVLSRDGVGYVQQARQLQAEKIDPEIAGPAAMPTVHYFYASYLSSRLFSLDPHTLGLATNIILGSLLPLLFFAMARQLWGSWELSLACAALAAVQPNLVAYSIEVQREIPHIFFVCCFGLGCMLFCRYAKWYWGAWMGGAAALSMVCRYEGVELLLFALIPFGILLYKKQLSRLRAALYFVIYVMTVLVTLWLLLSLVDFSPPDFFHAACQRAFGHMKIL